MLLEKYKEIHGEYPKMSVTWYLDKNRKNIVSLRSNEHGVDVSEVAKNCGGGGHKHAAGFSTYVLY